MIPRASPEETFQPSSHHSVSPPTSATSPMSRARPRLPAGPRTRKQTTLTQQQPSAHDDITKDQQRPSFGHVSLPSSEFPPPWTAPELDGHLSGPFPSSSPDALTPAGDPQTEPLPSVVGLDQSCPSHLQTSLTLDLFHSDTSQITSSFLQTYPPPEDRLVSTQPALITASGASRPATPTPIQSPSHSATKPALQNHPQATVSSTIVPPLTLPALQIDLTPEPLPYKHLTLDAAHWTLTSTELQHLVSSAIRQSAKEQFIRLLPPSVIDNSMPEDAARIERSWDTAAARWRFEAHRRNMLLRALSASGADSDLLAQLTGTLYNLDLQAQNLLHAAAHRMQLTAARDTHRASALAVALRKLNASYARRTRDLEKARAHVATLRSEVDEAWKVAWEQAAEVDKLKAAAAAAAAETQALTVTGPGDLVFGDDDIDEDDVSVNALQDGASIDLTMLSSAEVVDVTGKAVAAQARLTMMRIDHHSDSRPPTSAYGTSSPSSPMKSRSDNLQRPSSTDRRSSMASQVSRVSAARKRSKRKSRASLRLPGSMSVRSRSNVRGESGARSSRTRSKSRSKKGKEPAQAEPPVPWFPPDVEGSFLEMEGRPAGDETGDGQVGNDGDGYDDGNASVSEEPLPDSQTIEPSPDLRPSTPLSPSESQVVPTPKATAPTFSSQVTTPVEIAPLASTSTTDKASHRSSSSLPSTSAVPSVASTFTLPPSSDSHYSQSSHQQSNSAEVSRGVDLIPDPASIFSSIASSESTGTTAESTPDLTRRSYSLDLPSPSAKDGGKLHNTGSKIRRSISEFLPFGSASRVRRRSVPLPFKLHAGTTGFRAAASAIQQDLREESQGDEGLEDGWEDAGKNEA